MIIRKLNINNSLFTEAIFMLFYKCLKVKCLLSDWKKQEKSDLFFSNKIANFAIVEVSLNQ